MKTRAAHRFHEEVPRLKCPVARVGRRVPLTRQAMARSQWRRLHKCKTVAAARVYAAGVSGRHA